MVTFFMNLKEIWLTKHSEPNTIAKRGNRRNRRKVLYTIFFNCNGVVAQPPLPQKKNKKKTPKKQKKAEVFQKVFVFINISDVQNGKKIRKLMSDLRGGWGGGSSFFMLFIPHTRQGSNKIFA